jgi:PAS domain S-box-containing protein
MGMTSSKSRIYPSESESLNSTFHEKLRTHMTGNSQICSEEASLSNKGMEKIERLIWAIYSLGSEWIGLAAVLLHRDTAEYFLNFAWDENVSRLSYRASSELINQICNEMGDVRQIFFQESKVSRDDGLNQQIKEFLSVVRDRKLFSKFLRSKYYRQLRALEKAKVYEAITSYSFNSATNFQIPAFESLDSSIMSLLCLTNSWLPHLIASVEHTDFAFILTNSCGRRIDYINRHGENLTGFSRSEVFGKTFQVFTNPNAEDDDAISSVRHIPPSKIELTLYHKNGEGIRIYITTKSVCDVRNCSNVCWVSFFAKMQLTDDDMQRSRKQRQLLTLLSMVPDTISWIDCPTSYTHES